MKRVLAILLCLILCLGVVLSMAACNDDGSGDPVDPGNQGQQAHVHTFKTDADWSKDASGHWYDATCDCDDVTVRKLNHVDDNKDAICDVCKFEYDHEHTYAEDWTADCTNHWYAADCGCIIPGTEVGAHADENGDGECDVCKYVINDLHKHVFATEWSSDGENHWHAALCEHNVEVADKQAHTLNDAGYCTVCNEKLKEVDRTDVLAVLKAAVANNNKVVSGSVAYVNTIPDLNYTLTHDVYYVLGASSAYVKRIEYGMAKERWYQLIGNDEVFGVTSEDGGFTITPLSADIDSLKGYNYTPSTMLGSYDSTATLADTLYAIYDISLKDTVSNKVVSYNEETGVYTISYIYLEVRTLQGHDSLEDSGNDDSSAELQTVVLTNLYEVEASFTVDENFVIDSAEFVVGAYNQDIDGDYVYDVETGTYQMSASALADTYSYKVAQTSGERTYYTAYPKASIVPNSFDLMLPNGEIAGEEIKTAVGTYVQFYLTNLKPFSALSEFIDANDFTITTIDNATGEAAGFTPSYDSFSGAVCFNPNKIGSYTMTIKYGDFEKVYTLTITPAAPNSVKLYPFAWIEGFGEMVYTADEYNPGPSTKIELDVGETIDFLVRVNPSAAEQLYTITVDSTDATISEITVNNVVAFYEMLEECTAYQFKSDVEGKYVITLKSTVDENVTSTVEVYVGDVEQDVKTSETFEIPTPGNFAPSDEYVFTAGAAGTYVITADGLDASTWLQVYDAAEDSWPQIQGSLPYSVELGAGETLTLRLFGWDDAVTGQVVTVTVATDGGSASAGTTFEIPTPGNFAPSDEYVFTAGAAGTYVITADGLDASTWLQVYDAAEDSWPQIQGSLPYSVELGAGETLTLRLFGWDDAVAGQVVTVTVATDGGSSSADTTFEIPTPGNFAPSDEYVFTAGAAGTYVITADGLDASTWLQVYDAAEDSWPQIQGSLPYSVELGAGETLTLRLFGWDDAVTGQVVTVTVATGTAGEGGGDTPTLEGSGTDADPFVLVENGDYVCAFPGGYDYVFYKYTATQAGTLTISVLYDDIYWGIGNSAMSLLAGQNQT